MSVTINGDGTIGGVSAGGYGLTDADLPNGSVVQVVYAGSQPSSTLTTTSTSYVDTGISATITPSSSSNKVFVMAGLHVYLHGTGTAGWTRANFLIKRGTTNIFESADDSTGYTFSLHSNDANDRVMMKTHIPYLDSPATTSSTTYSIYANSANGYSISLTTAYGKSEITLMEIKA